MALIFDIETAGLDFDQMDEVTQDSLTRWIKRQANEDGAKYNALLQDLKEGLGFSPLTAEIVALGVFDTERNKGVVYFQAPDVDEKDWQEGSFSFKPKTEAEMINAFWQGARKYNTFVSFNGRAFDVPFILLRGAKYRIKPTLNLMAHRYLNSQYSSTRHIDLLDQLSFYGAVRRRGNLHLFCQALGIKSPKTEGITGDDVQKLFIEKKYREIAEYNSWDLYATAELYERWREYVKM